MSVCRISPRNPTRSILLYVAYCKQNAAEKFNIALMGSGREAVAIEFMGSVRLHLNSSCMGSVGRHLNLK